MKHRRFLAMISSVLLIMSMIICIAIPAFAADYPNDFPGLPSAPDGYSTYIIRYSYNGWAEAETYIVTFFNADDPVYFNGINLVKKNATMYVQFYYSNGRWNSLSPASTGSASFGDSVVGANFNIYDQNGALFFKVPTPPLVEVAESANLGAVMNQVVAILPIGLGCLAGYLGLRKALAFCRRILSGA